jgi:glycosyltransferase involved in cell wall biosynthesis
MDNISKGGSDIQYKFYQKYVNENLQNKIYLHRIPNTNSKSIYHLDEINQSKINVIWNQQSYDYLESYNLKNHYHELDKIVFVSNWQKQKFIDLLDCPKNKSIVILNGIEPIRKHIKPTNKVNLIYMSTPYRGLDVLLNSFQYLEDVDFNLHVFSSMKIYGQKEKDTEYEEMYDFCRKHQKINYYGSVPHSDVINFLEEIHIMSYPNTFEETSCISVLECMSAEINVVCSNFGALPETCSGFASIYEYNENKLIHAKKFAEVLRHSIINYKQENYKKQKEYFDNKHSWNIIKNDWNNLIKELIKIDKNKIVKYEY